MANEELGKATDENPEGFVTPGEEKERTENPTLSPESGEESVAILIARVQKLEAEVKELREQNTPPPLPEKYQKAVKACQEGRWGPENNDLMSRRNRVDLSEEEMRQMRDDLLTRFSIFRITDRAEKETLSDLETFLREIQKKKGAEWLRKQPGRDWD